MVKKTKEIKDLDIRQLVDKWVGGRRFGMDSGFYAGSRPNPGVLDSEILELIYRGIKNDIGQNEATMFVRFVDNLCDLSPSSFIIAMRKFWSTNCTQFEVTQEESDRDRIDSHNQAFALIAQTLSDKESSDETKERIRILSDKIKTPFVKNHRKELQ